MTKNIIHTITLIALSAITLISASPAHAACTNNMDGNPGVAGEIEYFTPDNVLRYCDGTDWVDMVFNAPPPADASTDFDTFLQFFVNALDEFRAAIANQFFAQTPSPEYIANAVEFDGSDYIQKTGDLNGVTDTKIFTMSGWIKRDVAGSSDRLFGFSDPTGGRIDILAGSGDQIRFRGSNASDTEVVDLLSSNSSINGDWQHVLISFDLSDSGKRHIYIDDTSDLNSAPIYIDDFIDMTDGIASVIGATASAAGHWVGDMADMWMDFGTYIDFSVEANRRKFISEAGYPVDLGTDGSTPTGSAPDIFLSGDTATWHTNKGTGGGFTENGALTDGTNVTSNGLLAHWKLDETSGGTAADFSPGGYDGAMSGGLSGGGNSQASVIGTGLDFDGTNDFVSLSSYPEDFKPSEFTISAWIKSDGCSDPSGCDIYRFRPFGQSLALVPSGRIRFTVTGTGPVDYTRFSPLTTYGDGEFHLVTGTFDGTNMTLYIDGAQVGIPTTASLSYGTGYAAIGRAGNFNGQYFDGVIDDVRIYDRALPAAEITALYDLGKDRASLVGHWQFEDTTGTTVTDSSLYGNDGSISDIDFGRYSRNGVIANGLGGFIAGTGSATTGLTSFPNNMLNANSSFTYAGWINTSTVSPPFQRISRRTGDSQSFTLTAASLGWRGISAANLTANTWNQFAITFDVATTTCALYLNGVSQGTAACTTPSDYSQAFSRFSWSNGGLLGAVDDLRLYNRALSSTEILALYNDANSALVGHWKLDETTGTTAADSTQYGYNGTLSGTDFAASTVSSPIDTGFSVDGTDDCIITSGTATTYNTLETLTVSAWIKPQATTTTNKRIATKGANAWGLQQQSGNTLDFLIDTTDNGGANLRVTGPAVDTTILNKWVHLVGTYDGTIMRLYVDGTEFDNIAQSGLINDSAQEFSIGAAAPLCAEAFSGDIDDTRIYNRALTAAEVLELYNKPNEALVGHWRLDETSGTTATDSSINGNDGTMTNGLDATNDSSEGIYETGLNFDGIDDTIEFGDILDLSGSSLTLSAWINPKSIPSTDPVTFITRRDQSAGPNYNGDYVFSINTNGSLNFAKYSPSLAGWQNAGSNASQNVSLNEWQHAVFTFDNATLTGKIYLNGVEVDSDVYATPIESNTGTMNFKIGNSVDFSGESPFDGDIDDVRIYNRTLSAAEVTELYNNANSPLAGHWKLDETSGTIAADSSQYGNTGIIDNAIDASTITTDGIVDTAFSFDATNTDINVAGGDSLDNIRNVTISAWVIPRLSNTFNRVVTKNDAYQMEFRTTNGAFTLKVEDQTSVSVSLPTPLEEKWYHLAGTFNADTDEVRYYLNGQFLGTVTNTEEFAINTNQIQLGGGSSTRPNALDDVRIYNKVLSGAEIAKLVNNSTGGLVAHYRLDETSGTTAIDSSIFGNDGTMVGGLDASNDRTDGPMNTALDFDGVNDRINGIPFGDDELGTEHTFAYWTRLDRAPDQKIGFGKSGSRANVVVGVKDDQVITYANAGGSEVNGGIVPTGEWVHLAMVRNGTNIRHFINGASAGGGTLSNTAPIDIDLFGFRGSSGEFFDGQADDLRIYNRALTASEILALFNAGDPPVPDTSNGLVGYWKLDETSGTTATDSSGNSNDGTMQDGLNATSDNIAAVIDRGLYLDGLEDHIDLPSGLTTTTVGTISHWLRPDETKSMMAYYQSDTPINGEHNGFGQPADILEIHTSFRNTGAFSFNFQDGTGSTSRFGISSPSGLETGKWYHVAATWDLTGNAYLYVDGIQVNSFNASSLTYVGNTPNTYFIGRTGDGQAVSGLHRDWIGGIDDVRIYNRVLSADEIQILAACTGPAGTQFYNYTDNIQQWCGGAAEAINMGPKLSATGSGCGNQNNTGIARMNYETGINSFVYCNSEYDVPIGRGCADGYCGGDSAHKIVFTINNRLFQSDFSGVTGADALCQKHADEAGLSGDYDAWIADSNAASAPATRFSSAITGGAFAFYKTDGTLIANNWSDLTDGTIASNLDTGAFGITNNEGGFDVFSNVDTDGTQLGTTNTCSDYTATTGNFERGRINFNNTNWTNSGTSACLGGQAFLYCFEQ